MMEHTEDFRESKKDYIKFLRDNASCRNIDSYFEGEPEIRPSRIGFNSETLLNNLQFENYVEDRLITTYNMKTEYKEAKKIIEDLISSIKI